MHGSIPMMCLAAALLAGCSNREDEKPAGVLPHYQQQALKDAGAVQDMIGDADARRRAELEQAE